MQWAYLFLSELMNKHFTSFSVLISNLVTIQKYNPHKQVLFGILNNF